MVIWFILIYVPGTKTYTWKKDGVSVSGSGNTLGVPSFSSSHEGDYTCQVTIGGLISLDSAAVQLTLAGLYT